MLRPTGRTEKCVMIGRRGSAHRHHPRAEMNHRSERAKQEFLQLWAALLFDGFINHRRRAQISFREKLIERIIFLFFLEWFAIGIEKAIARVPFLDALVFKFGQSVEVFLSGLAASFATIFAVRATFVAHFYKLITFAHATIRHQRFAAFQTMDGVKFRHALLHLGANALKSFKQF